MVVYLIRNAKGLNRKRILYFLSQYFALRIDTKEVRSQKKRTFVQKKVFCLEKKVFCPDAKVICLDEFSDCGKGFGCCKILPTFCSRMIRQERVKKEK